MLSVNGREEKSLWYRQTLNAQSRRPRLSLCYNS